MIVRFKAYLNLTIYLLCYQFIIMGCCQPVGTNHNTSNSLNDKVFSAIRLNSIKRLESILKFHLKSSTISAFDDLHLIESKKILNPLAFSGFLGRSSIFLLLLKYGSNLTTMESLLDQQNLSLMEIICVNGHIDLLKIYFSYYIQKTKSNQENEYSSSFIMECKNDLKISPVKLACQYGHVSIVDFFYKYCKNSENKSPEFNVYAIDEVTGENCAFVACRYGHIELVKYLNINCKVDFLCLNNNKENTIMVTVAGMKKNMNFSYIDIVEYLIENVKVDLLYNYEEILISAQVPCLVEYLEKKLNEFGIRTSKKSVDTNILRPANFMKESLESNNTIFTPSVVQNIEDYCRNSRISSIPPVDRSLLSEHMFEDSF